MDLDRSTLDALGATADNVTLTLPPELSFDEWVQVGKPVLAAAKTSMWWVGDWLLFAFERYGTDPSSGQPLSSERARIRRAVAELTDLAASTLKNAVNVARKFPPDRRRGGLTFSHHREAASAEPDVADALLEDAEREGWSVNDVTAERRRRAASSAPTRHKGPPHRACVLVRLSVPVAHAGRLTQLTASRIDSLCAELADEGIDVKATVTLNTTDRAA